MEKNSLFTLLSYFVVCSIVVCAERYNEHFRLPSKKSYFFTRWHFLDGMAFYLDQVSRFALPSTIDSQQCRVDFKLDFAKTGFI